MAGKDDAVYSGPLSPEEKAECDREMEEMRRQNFEQLDRDIDDANIKHSNLQLPRDSSVPAVPHIQRLIPKGRGSEKRPYDESPEVQSSCHKFCVVMVVSDGLRSSHKV